MTTEQSPASVTSITGKQSDRQGHRICSCGSHWWELWTPSDDDPPRFTYSNDNEIVGWTGEFVCAECGDWMDPELQRVEDEMDAAALTGPSPQGDDQ